MSTDGIGFSLGLVTKTAILILQYKLILTNIQTIAEMRSQLKSKNLIAEKFNQIIGRTFHEITPPLLQLEARACSLIDDNDVPMHKKVRREIEQISGDVYRMKTILAATSRMYYFDTLKINPSSLDFPIPIKVEVDVQNVNIMIEIAITTLKTVIAIYNQPASKIIDIERNFYTTDKIFFKTEYGGNCNVYGNSVEFVEIFYNIFKNSFEAVEVNDYACNIYIKTKNIFESEHIDGEKVKKRIQIEIEDNGPGIPSDIYEQIFYQGYSTKTGVEGRGRGFGLNIVKSLSDQYGGTISIESPIIDPRVRNLEQRPGTKFTLTFPKYKVDE